MARSLLRQLEQIRRSATYDDAVSGLNTSAVAEPTVSGSLEHDVNVIRSIVKQLKGGTDWYSDPGNYFDPSNTTSGDAEQGTFNLESVRNQTLNTQTIIIAVSNDNGGSGYTVDTTSSGVLATITTRYATDNNRIGLPIYYSDSNDYYDEGGDLRVCRVDVIDMDTAAEFVDGSGNTVYALMHDAADEPWGGTGSLTDVYFRFYSNGSPITMVSGTTSVSFIYPERKVMTDMEEYQWLRTDFVSSWEGDVELIEDIQNLWSFTGAGDDVTDPTWDNTTANYMLQTGPTDLEAAVNLLNDGIGNRNYSFDYYVTDGDPITSSLDDLDQAIKSVEDQISAGIGEKYVESVTSGIVLNVEHTVPYGLSYTASSTAGREGKNMDIYVDGQLLAADTGAAGANADRDYGETSASGITFRFNIQVGRNITYIIRQ